MKTCMAMVIRQAGRRKWPLIWTNDFQTNARLCGQTVIFIVTPQQCHFQLADQSHPTPATHPVLTLTCTGLRNTVQGNTSPPCFAHYSPAILENVTLALHLHCIRGLHKYPVRQYQFYKDPVRFGKSKPTEYARQSLHSMQE